MIALARTLVNPKDEISLLRILTNFPAFSLTTQARDTVKEATREKAGMFWDALQDLTLSSSELSNKARAKIERLLAVYRDLGHELEAAAKTPSLAALFESMAQQTSYLDDIEEERALNIWELVDSATEFQKENPQASLSDFLNHTSLMASTSLDNNRAKDDQPRMSLMTAHLAKGLEFKAVFLTGLEEGLFPFKISRSNPQEIEEERRLFYVGMTRAEDTLTLSYAKKRTLFGSYEENSPSRFLYEAGVLDGDWEYKPVIKRGGRVKHPLFGEGRIISVSGSGANAKVTVHFERSGTRKFLAEVAPLEPI
ncbi:MAG: 3'-5' exonuclease, partial [Elusimicrobiota bacterium]